MSSKTERQATEGARVDHGGRSPSMAPEGRRRVTGAGERALMLKRLLRH